jgi:hypothetical protein
MLVPADSPLTCTDEQVTDATGLHVDNLRKLITWGAIKPVQGGGGRGRVRKWTTRQALRIAVTAQFVEAGFSLQMAHTITYCLPLDDLLYVYDPELLEKVIAAKGLVSDQRLLIDLTASEAPEVWPGADHLGSRTLIVDGRYLYTDALGQSPTLWAVIDAERQRVFPEHFSPLQFLPGTGMAHEYGLPRDADAAKIDRGSLLIDDAYLVRRKRRKELPEGVLPLGIPHQVIGLESLICRSLLVINLALGMMMCVRRLRGLPTPYKPVEIPYDEQ